MSLSRIIPLALILFGAGSLPSQQPAAGMKKDVLAQPFYVAGFLVRTNNAAEASGESKIGPLWQRFMQEKLVDQIPNRTDAAFTVVYSNYASDETGAYDYLLGARVSSIDHLPAGMSWRKVEPATYVVILTERGPMPGVLQAAWDRIWHMAPGELGGKRAFLTDYEIYDKRTVDPQNAQVEIHIGLTSGSH
ncbi:MAG: GyrI-like domain-containing protein [Terracidiphilus sp.]